MEGRAHTASSHERRCKFTPGQLVPDIRLGDHDANRCQGSPPGALLIYAVQLMKVRPLLDAVESATFGLIGIKRVTDVTSEMIRTIVGGVFDSESGNSEKNDLGYCAQE